MLPVNHVFKPGQVLRQTFTDNAGTINYDYVVISADRFGVYALDMSYYHNRETDLDTVVCRIADHPTDSEHLSEVHPSVCTYSIVDPKEA